MEPFSTVKSAEDLTEWRKFHEMTIDDLTEAANAALRKAKAKDRNGQPIRLRRGVVGHLCSGRNTATTPDKAKAIEKALNQPIGKLFDHDVARSVQRNDTAA